jgi:hypothetical protein
MNTIVALSYLLLNSQHVHYTPLNFYRIVTQLGTGRRNDMPALEQLAAKTGQTVIVYGPPKSGKTTLVVGQLLRHYKVIYVDLEKGRTTLFKMDKALLANLDVIAIKDNKDTPMAIDASIKLASGGKRIYCLTHQKLDCVACKTSRDPEVVKYLYEYEFNTLDPQEYAVVFDSFTQIASSAKAHVGKGLNPPKIGEMPSTNKFEFDHWSALGILLEKFLDYVQCASFNVVVITHEMGIEQEDGIEKLMPSGGTKNFARTIAKYFDHIVYCNIRNRKHKAESSTTAENKILTGSRTSVEVSTEDPDSMARLLGKIGLAEPTITSTKTSGSSNSALLNRLKK